MSGRSGLTIANVSNVYTTQHALSAVHLISHASLRRIAADPEGYVVVPYSAGKVTDLPEIDHLQAAAVITTSSAQ